MTPPRLRRAGTTQRVRTIKADQSAQLRLLDVQAVDTALAQLTHRRRTLPEHAEIARLQAERAAVESDLVAADTAVSDLELEQDRAESDLEPVRERLVRNQQRIADGSVPDPKALASMVDEVEHLKKRIGDLEDAELEVMEQLETEAAGREKLRARAAELDETAGRLSAKRDAQLAELAADMAERRAERDELTPTAAGAAAGPLREDRRQPRRRRRRRAAAAPLHRLPARGQRRRPARLRRRRRPTRCCAARSAAASWSARRTRGSECPIGATTADVQDGPGLLRRRAESDGAEFAATVLDIRAAAGRGGRRRLARQPGAGGVRGAGPRRRRPGRS